MTLEQIDPDSPVKNYTDAPLKVLHEKLSALGHKNRSPSPMPEEEPDFSREVALEVTDTDLMIPSDEEEDKVNKSINSFNISACGNLRFNRYSDKYSSPESTTKLTDSIPKNPFKEFIGKCCLMNCRLISWREVEYQSLKLKR